MVFKKLSNDKRQEKHNAKSTGNDPIGVPVATIHTDTSKPDQIRIYFLHQHM